MCNRLLALQHDEQTLEICFGLQPESGTRAPRTVGWRLATDRELAAPIPWVEDLDEDGEGELILWRSFPGVPGAGNSQKGLIGWVYELEQTRLLLEPSLSRKLARRVVSWFAGPPDTPAHRGIIEQLQAFANGTCFEDDAEDADGGPPRRMD